MSNLENPQNPNPCIMDGTTLLQWLDPTLTNLAIPEGVTEIGEKAFADCQALVSLTLPSTLQVIGAEAFSGCTSLTSIEIPEGVTSLQEGTFMHCESLVSVTLPQSLYVMDEKAFYYCKALTTLNLPKSIDALGNQCFMGCASLTWETLPETVLFLGYQVFYHCHGLTSFTLHKSIQFLGEEVFSRCNSLTSMTILAPLETLPRAAFYRSPSLTEIHLPDTVTNLGDYTFQGCTSLTQIHLPDSLTELGQSLFQDCTSLTQIHIPDSVTELGSSLFQGCTSLTQIHLPESLTKVGSSLFQDCTSLETVTFPTGIQTLESFCFQSCTSLQSMVLPDSIQHIKTCVFRFCTSLQEIHLPKDLKSVKDSVFQDCTSLKRIYKSHSTTPCQWDFMALPRITQFDFLDLPVLADLNLWQQHAYCQKHWEGALHKEITQFLFSQPKWVDYALSRDFLPLIVCLLEQMETLSLLQLGDYIQTSIEGKSTEITATFFDYRNKHYSQEEVEAFYTRQDMIDCGFELPTYEEFSRFWHCEIEEGEIEENVERLAPDRKGTVKITGYRGHRTEEVIPKVLADGKIIGSFVHGEEMVSSPSLTHLRIEADLWDCDVSFGMYDLQSLEITGTVFGNIFCRSCRDLTSCTYEGKGHKDLKLIFSNTNISSFTVPDGVTTLLGYSFRNCGNLQTITIPPSVVEIGEAALEGCSNLTVYGEKGSVAETYCLAQGIAFAERKEANPKRCPNGT